MYMKRIASILIISVLLISLSLITFAQPSISPTTHSHGVPHIGRHGALKVSPLNASIKVIINPNWTFVNLTSYIKTATNLSGGLLLEKINACNYRLNLSLNGYNSSLNLASLSLRSSGEELGKRVNNTIYINTASKGYLRLMFVNKTNSLYLESWLTIIRNMSTSVTPSKFLEHVKILSNSTFLNATKGPRNSLAIRISNLVLDSWSRGWRENKVLKTSSKASLVTNVTLIFNGVPIPVGRVDIKWKENTTTTIKNAITDFDLLMTFENSYIASLVYNTLKTYLSNLGIKNVTITQPSPTQVEVKGHLVEKLFKEVKEVNLIKRITHVPTPLLAALNASVSGFKLSYSNNIMIEKGNVSISSWGSLTLRCNRSSEYSIKYLKAFMMHKDKSNYSIVNVQMNATHPEPVTSFLIGKSIVTRLLGKVKEEKMKVHMLIESSSKDVKFRLGKEVLSSVYFTEKNLTRAPALHMLYKGGEFGGYGEILKVITTASKYSLKLPLTAKKLEIIGPKKVIIKLPSQTKASSNLTITVTNNIAVNLSITILPGSSINSSLDLDTLSKEEATGLIPKNLSARVIGPGLKVRGARGQAIIKIPVEIYAKNVALLIVEENGTYRIIKNVNITKGFIIISLRRYNVCSTSGLTSTVPLILIIA
jgi:hypothetical protein